MYKKSANKKFQIMRLHVFFVSKRNKNWERYRSSVIEIRQIFRVFFFELVWKVCILESFLAYLANFLGLFQVNPARAHFLDIADDTRVSFSPDHFGISKFTASPVDGLGFSVPLPPIRVSF